MNLYEYHRARWLAEIQDFFISTDFVLRYGDGFEICSIEDSLLPITYLYLSWYDVEGVAEVWWVHPTDEDDIYYGPTDKVISGLMKSLEDNARAWCIRPIP